MTSRPRPVAWVAAIDVGGTTVKAAAFDRQRAMLHRLAVPTPEYGNPSALLDTVVDLVGALGSMPQAVGVVLPATVDAETGTVEYAANIGIKNVPLRALLSERLGVLVAVDQDGIALAMAEATRGSARDRADVLAVGLGTGIAIGVIADGRILGRRRTRAGELGHAPVVPDGEPCACGSHGCAEAYAGGAGLRRRYFVATGRNHSPEQIVNAVRAGDAAATSVFADAVAALAAALAGYVATMDPEVIVVGGGLSAAGATLLEPLREAVAGLLPWRPPPEIELSRWGADGALVGAGEIAWSAAEVSAAARGDNSQTPSVSAPLLRSRATRQGPPLGQSASAPGSASGGRVVGQLSHDAP